MMANCLQKEDNSLTETFPDTEKKALGDLSERTFAETRNKFCLASCARRSSSFSARNTPSILFPLRLTARYLYFFTSFSSVRTLNSCGSHCNALRRYSRTDRDFHAPVREAFPQEQRDAGANRRTVFAPRWPVLSDESIRRQVYDDKFRLGKVFRRFRLARIQQHPFEQDPEIFVQNPFGRLRHLPCHKFWITFGDFAVNFVFGGLDLFLFCGRGIPLFHRFQSALFGEILVVWIFRRFAFGNFRRLGLNRLFRVGIRPACVSALARAASLALMTAISAAT